MVGRDVLVNQLPVYTYDELKTHLEEGETDKNDELTIFHPNCTFCEKYFFDIQKFVNHMKKDHESCHVCSKDYPHRYYRDYETLKKHHEKTHFTCRYQSCLEKGFVVFRSEQEREHHYVNKISLNPFKEQRA